MTVFAKAPRPLSDPSTRTFSPSFKKQFRRRFKMRTVNINEESVIMSLDDWVLRLAIMRGQDRAIGERTVPVEDLEWDV
jgi:hypothetical protein